MRKEMEKRTGEWSDSGKVDLLESTATAAEAEDLAFQAAGVQIWSSLCWDWKGRENVKPWVRGESSLYKSTRPRLEQISPRGWPEEAEGQRGRPRGATR